MAADLSPIDWALLPLKRYAQFNGRAPRAEYWWFYLATLIVDRVLSFVDKRGFGEDGLTSGLFGLIILVPWIAVTVRRLHDINRSGWWLMIVVIPLVAFVGIAIQAAVLGGDAVTDAPVAFYTSLVVTIIAALVIFVFLVTPGTTGTNRFGEDPYGPDQLEEIFA